MDKTTFYKIQTWLADNNIAKIDSSQAKMQQRKDGKTFTIEEHLKGMIFSLLSAQMVWKKIEENEQQIDELFFHYNPQEIKEHDWQYFVNGLAELRCRNWLTNKNMKALRPNIETMEKIIQEYGSMDAFVTSKPQSEIVRMLTKAASPYKMKQMGSALAWEYLRNIGVDGAKPDVHMKRILGSKRLGISEHENAEDDEVLEAVRKLSEETGFWMADIDYLIWCYCASGKGEICTANPDCDRCVIRNECIYPKGKEEQQKLLYY